MKERFVSLHSFLIPMQMKIVDAFVTSFDWTSWALCLDSRALKMSSVLDLSGLVQIEISLGRWIRTLLKFSFALRPLK